MRFAAVPFIRRAVDSEDGDGEEKEEVVWFATISDPSLVEYDTLDAAGRKRLLLEAFGSWHDPVRALIESRIAFRGAHLKAITSNDFVQVAVVSIIVV